MFEKKDLELTAGLGVALGLIAIEMVPWKNQHVAYMTLKKL